MIDPKRSPDENLRELQEYLKRGASDPKFPFRYTTLSTSEADSGVPSARMLVLRDIDDEGCFVMFSDLRSEKIEELRGNTQTHLLFWHPLKQVQIGINAEMQLHQKDSLAEKYMHTVSAHGKQQYTSINPPSTPVDSPEAGLKHDKDLFESNFCILRARPWRFTALQLRREGHLRLRFQKAGNTWEGGWITP